MIPGGTPNPPLRRVVDAPFTSKSHFGLLAVRCLSYMGWGSPLFLPAAEGLGLNPVGCKSASYQAVNWYSFGW